MKLVLKSNFESLPSFEPSFTQFTQYEQEDLALKVWGRNQLYHNSGISNSMMQLLMLLTTLNEISLYITICFKESKTFEYICTLLRKWK